jgi:hypothetical protein
MQRHKEIQLMKTFPILIVLCWACFGCAGTATADVRDPRAALNDAQSFALQGRYEEALQKHLWFHENALKYAPAMTGVRLSFALMYWIQLGEKYPKARQALVSIRDRDTQECTGGKGSFALFMDVAGINRALKEEPKTVELFKTLHAKNPELAQKCYHVAEPYLVAQHEYRICSAYIADPLQRFERIEARRKMNLEYATKGNPRMEEFAETWFADETCRLIEILVGVDRKQEAETVRKQALAVRDDPRIRDAGQKALPRPK